jgi:hypothetical protein
VPAIPLELEFAGTLFEIVIFAETAEKATVLVDALPEGSRRTKTLSVLATLEACGISDNFLLLSVIIYPPIRRQEE